MDYKALGNRIRLQRKLMGITQEMLSEKVGISCSFMGHIERGTRKMSLDTLVKISDTLNISCDTLLRESLKERTESTIEGVSERRQRILNEIVTMLHENDV